MDKTTRNIINRYDRISSVYDFFESPMEKMSMSEWRKDALRDLKGTVLEVGVGTGKNIEFYPEGIDITAIDFSPKMLKKAREKADRLGKTVKFMEMDVQNLEFDDNTFDMVFTTCVFCSVPDPIKGLKEIRRVCKPGGKIIMLEHVRSEGKLMGPLMDLFNPLVVNLYGANINRNTLDNISRSGFEMVKFINLFRDIVKKIEILNVKP